MTMTTWNVFSVVFCLSCWFALKVTVTSECCPAHPSLSQLSLSERGPGWCWLKVTLAELPGWAWIRYESVECESSLRNLRHSHSHSQCQGLVTCRDWRMRTGDSLEKEASCGLPSHTGSTQQPTFNTKLHVIYIWYPGYKLYILLGCMFVEGWNFDCYSVCVALTCRNDSCFNVSICVLILINCPITITAQGSDKVW